MYNSIIHHLHISLCAHHPKSSLSVTIFLAHKSKNVRHSLCQIQNKGGSCNLPTRHLHLMAEIVYQTTSNLYWWRAAAPEIGRESWTPERAAWLARNKSWSYPRTDALLWLTVSMSSQLHLLSWPCKPQGAGTLGPVPGSHETSTVLSFAYWTAACSDSFIKQGKFGAGWSFLFHDFDY